MKKYKLFDRFSNVVLGFIDSIPIFQKKYPGRKKRTNYSQGSLLKDFVGPEAAENAHNALADVSALKQLIEKTNITENELRNNSKSVKQFWYDGCMQKVEKEKKESFAVLNGVKPTICLKLAKNGLSLKKNQ